MVLPLTCQRHKLGVSALCDITRDYIFRSVCPTILFLKKILLKKCKPVEKMHLIIFFWIIWKKTYSGKMISEVNLVQYGNYFCFILLSMSKEKNCNIHESFPTRQFHFLFKPHPRPHTTHILQPLHSWPVSIISCKCHHKPTFRLLFLNYYIQVKFFNFWMTVCSTYMCVAISASPTPKLLGWARQWYSQVPQHILWHI